MRVVNLIENTKGKQDCQAEHGLSFYIETRNHKLLVDTGATDAFLANAEILGIDLSKADICVLSHGHYDHGGGILAFAKMNPKAKIVMNREAIGEYYHINASMEKYIGIDPEIRNLPQAEFVDGDKRIDEALYFFGGVTGRKRWPEGNRELKEKRNGVFLQDEFRHEQYLVVSENGKNVLVSGCAHNGILNILEKYQQLFGSWPDLVISGFHMRKKSGYEKRDEEIIRATARELVQTDTVFYTGHCTGEIPYQIMKEIMGERLHKIHSGDEITGNI